MHLRDMLSNPDEAMNKNKGEKSKDTKEGESSGVKGEKSFDIARSRAATPERKTPEGENASTQPTSPAREDFVGHFIGSLQRNLPQVSPERDRGSNEGGQDSERQSLARKGKRRQPPEKDPTNPDLNPLQKRRRTVPEGHQEIDTMDAMIANLNRGTLAHWLESQSEETGKRASHQSSEQMEHTGFTSHTPNPYPTRPYSDLVQASSETEGLPLATTSTGIESFVYTDKSLVDDPNRPLAAGSSQQLDTHSRTIEEHLPKEAGPSQPRDTSLLEPQARAAFSKTVVDNALNRANRRHLTSTRNKSREEIINRNKQLFDDLTAINSFINEENINSYQVKKAMQRIMNHNEADWNYKDKNILIVVFTIKNNPRIQAFLSSTE